MPRRIGGRVQLEVPRRIGGRVQGEMPMKDGSGRSAWEGGFREKCLLERVPRST